MPNKNKSGIEFIGQTSTIKSFSSQDIINQYQSILGINVARFFESVKTIDLVECHKTGYQFYLPQNIYGDSLFYEDLQKFEWYYMPWKWEHQYSLELFGATDKILEVGSGGLGFIEKISNKGFEVVGLELNRESVVKAQKLNLNVLDCTIQDFSKENENKFDVVCSYQVLEHISDVGSFLESQIKCLRTGGKLIISVPNNNSFIKYDEGGILNFPPHHMGRWNTQSLTSIAKVYNLELIEIRKESLQDYHIAYYTNIVTMAYLKKSKLVRFVNRFISLNKIITIWLKIYKLNIDGHSIVAVYKKI